MIAHFKNNNYENNLQQRKENKRLFILQWFFSRFIIRNRNDFINLFVMSSYTLKELGQIYGRSPDTIQATLKRGGFIGNFVNKKKFYDESVKKFLNQKYQIDGIVVQTIEVPIYKIDYEVEIIQVPVYIDVNWLVLPSKLNYLPDELL